ncbi:MULTISPECIES: RidA family protein [Rhodobacterales]|jgi:enamine deaminase RidA (YjgF/YER057c/UK114 family)|uniref:Endoribonuclease L-PSP n=1 Tax=Phaeobacter gallaeciensis TaxID=60890 RepID=A0A1B0ZMJ9_9RHOB|nr:MULTISPECIES: RidA family protein [Phaeobacter]MDF1771177.1 RidA family protein [Pseudophaeobacter sp. bin_em_oilr2.035]MEE2634300.1 RidA family protein [Pseudomonadota bacterium]ANP35402.1 endoribonuclease L-PSP [Phaeobacter gallaeciensis]MDE4062052.1 RidA family protein [Phaeobacter gallaeciensis]MDE4099028.1 RidA family protein [Phaeobacter gallaeciensis]
MPAINVHPEGWKPAKGYANGMVAEGKLLFVGGQIGWTADQVFEAKDFIGQMSQALRNILDVVETAGGAASDITRLTWYVTDKAEYMAHQAEVGKAYRDVMGYHFPAMTMVVVSALVEDEAKVEIEATAVLSN